MSPAETCPFCGAQLSSLGFDGKHFKSFSCGTTIWHHKDPESIRSRECRIDERDRLQACIAALEAEAKQAREDEAWAHAENVGCVPRGEDGWQAYRWSARMQRMDRENAPTIHAALRALRVKVEGGAR